MRLKRLSVVAPSLFTAPWWQVLAKAKMNWNNLERSKWKVGMLGDMPTFLVKNERACK